MDLHTFSSIAALLLMEAQECIFGVNLTFALRSPGAPLYCGGHMYTAPRMGQRDPQCPSKIAK